MNFESGGGTERVTSVIANELVKKNFDVRIISSVACVGMIKSKKEFFERNRNEKEYE